jgi:hypothetical protein
VADLLEGRILVGHAVKNDMEALLLSHPRRDIRDTSRYAEFKKYSKGRTPGLKKLTKEILGIDIQGGQHSSVSFPFVEHAAEEGTRLIEWCRLKMLGHVCCYTENLRMGLRKRMHCSGQITRKDQKELVKERRKRRRLKIRKQEGRLRRRGGRRRRRRRERRGRGMGNLQQKIIEPITPTSMPNCAELHYTTSPNIVT